MARDDEQFPLRLSTELRDRIKAEAVRNKRSMNAEILMVLEKEFPAPHQEPQKERTS